MNPPREFDLVWAATIKRCLAEGVNVSPRGKLTRELSQHTCVVDMRSSVLLNPARKLSYKFMAAEAYWILSGDDTVAGIAPWNPNIAQFSDDGEKYFGAYGPKIVSQLPYVVKKLQDDPVSRQAGLTIWRECPPDTKDVPCTVAIFAAIRDGLLNLHVFMRSSDIWLGLPYDTFNFSMLAHLICCRLNDGSMGITPGTLYLTAASSHLYEPHWGTAAQASRVAEVVKKHRTSPDAWSVDEKCLMEELSLLRDSGPNSEFRWWL